METGLVRAILLRHATAGPSPAAAQPPAPSNVTIRVGSVEAAVPAQVPDPNGLAPAAHLHEVLAALTPAEQERLARDYVALWARTFRTLVRHLRGRPERAVTLLAEEVYPYLRGVQRPVTVERVGRRGASLRLDRDLPAPYLSALAEAFVGLSGARVTATHAVAATTGSVHVRWHTAPGDGMARASQNLADLRLPLFVAALLSTAVGIALATRAESFDAVRAGLVVVGVAGVQFGLTAVHDLLAGSPSNPLGPTRASRKVLAARAVASYGVAAVCGVMLVASHLGVLVFGAIGLALSLLYSKWRDNGLGPFVAGLAYGPIVGLGTLYAVAGMPSPATIAPFALTTLPLGFLAAAVLFLDDLADRPLDEAGGNRTLAVRLPRSSHVPVFAFLLLTGLATFAGAAIVWFTWYFLLAIVLAAPAIWLVAQASAHLDDPHGLGPARLGTAILLALTGAAMLAMLQVPT